MRPAAAALGSALALIAAAADADAPAPGDGFAGWRLQLTLFGAAATEAGRFAIDKPPYFDEQAGARDVFRPVNPIVGGEAAASSELWLIGADVGATLGWRRHTIALIPGPIAPNVTTSHARLLESEIYSGWRVPVAADRWRVYATLGVRFNQASADLEMRVPVFRADRSRAAAAPWLDATAGLAAQWDIEARYRLRARGDVGGFGLMSQFTAFGEAAVDARLTSAISASLGYRAFYDRVDLNKGGGQAFRMRAMFGGPFAGLTLNF